MPSFAGKIEQSRLLINVIVSIPNANGDEDPLPSSPMPFRALLDTGATISCVSQKVVDALKLIPDGWKPITGVHGTKNTPTLSVAMHIPISEIGADGQVIHLRGSGKMGVTLLDFQPEDFDVIIGMDLLQECHMSMSNGMFFLSV